MKTFAKVIFVAATAYPLAASAETLFLDVYLNGVPVKNLVEFDYTQNHFWSTEKVLENSALADYASELSGRVDYCNLQGISCNYSYESQRLYLTADTDLFPAQRITNQPRSALPITKSSGALLNYDIYYRNYQGGTASTDILQQWRAFNDLGIFETTANYRKAWGGADNSFVDEGMIRYDSFWQYNDEENMRYWRVGDMISGGNPWARQIRMGGIKLSRRFDLNPQFVSYPYPEFIGSAVLPSDVELFVNNYKMFSGNVEPGNFILDSEPSVNGLASASIVTTDINGQAVTRDLQFYVAPELLRQGVYDYDLNLGVLRQGYGLTSFDYDANLTAIADVRYGLTDNISVSTHAELSKDVYNLGVGTDFSLANMGVFSLAVAKGKDQADSGWLGLAGYRFQADNWGVSAQIKQQQQGYRDTAATQFVSQTKREIQVNAAYSFDNGVSMGMGYFDIQKFDDDKRRLISAFYNQSLDNLSVSASINWDPDKRDVSAGLNLSIPFGKRSRASINHVQNNKSESRTVASASFSRNGNRGFRGNVSNVIGSSDVSANGSWRGDKIELASGYYHRDGASGYWGQASGSLILSKNRVLMGNRVADTFAVVSTGGIANVPVLVENKQVGESDDDGLLLVTGLASYNPVNISISTKTLALDTNVVNDRVQVMAAENKGVEVDFELYQTKAAIVIVNDELGEPIPVGAVATLNGEHNGEFVGWDGELYLEKLLDNNTLTLMWDNKQCVLEFPYSKKDDDIPVLGPLQCVPAIANALVQVVDDQAQPIPAGSLAMVNDQADPVVVGRNGELALSALMANNIITLNWANKQCSAEFNYRKVDEQTPVIGPITCQRKRYAATVIVNDTQGEPIPAGAKAIINDTHSETVARFGEVYPQALQQSNQMLLQWDNKQCSVTFSYKPVNHQKAIIGPLECQQSIISQAIEQTVTPINEFVSETAAVAVPHNPKQRSQQAVSTETALPIKAVTPLEIAPQARVSIPKGAAKAVFNTVSQVKPVAVARDIAATKHAAVSVKVVKLLAKQSYWGFNKSINSNALAQATINLGQRAATAEPVGSRPLKPAKITPPLIYYVRKQRFKPQIQTVKHLKVNYVPNPISLPRRGETV